MNVPAQLEIRKCIAIGILNFIQKYIIQKKLIIIIHNFGTPFYICGDLRANLMVVAPNGLFLLFENSFQ